MQETKDDYWSYVTVQEVLIKWERVGSGSRLLSHEAESWLPRWYEAGDKLGLDVWDASGRFVWMLRRISVLLSVATGVKLMGRTKGVM